MMKPGLCFISPVFWNGLRQRHQALAEGFAARGIPVDYVNPIMANGFGTTIQPVGPNLRVISVHVPFRAAEWPGLQKMVVRWVAFLLDRQVGIKPASSILWLADPALAGLNRRPWEASFYDRCDRHGTFPGQKGAIWQKYERELYSTVRTVFASSSLLCDESRSLGASRVVLLQNAAETGWVCVPQVGKPEKPPLRAISSGAHFEWVDMAWLEFFADHPQVELHIAGLGRGKSFTRVVKKSRVVHHGRLSHEALQGLLDQSHVGLVPFIDGPLTRGVDPVKVYEYAARGLEVWSSGVEEMRNHPLITRVLPDKRAIDSAVGSFIRNETLSVPRKLIPTWNDRVDAVIQASDGLLGE